MCVRVWEIEEVTYSDLFLSKYVSKLPFIECNTSARITANTYTSNRKQLKRTKAQNM